MFKDLRYTVNGLDNSNTRAYEDEVKHCCSIGGHAFLDSLLIEQQQLMETLANCKLYPTYAYARIHWAGSALRKHTDRESCEFSATICIDNDPDPWPLFVEQTKYILEPGDMLVYRGRDLKHWRETYTGKQQIQIFIHYVEEGGKYSEFKYDKRPCLGHTYQKK